MTKRERVQAVFHNEEVDRVPACFWWHFPADLPEEEMAARHLAFFRETGEDMLKISSDGFFGWPAEALQAPYDVKKLYDIRHLPADHPYIRKQVERAKAITGALDEEAVTIYTTFNPLSLLRLQVGWDQMMSWMREDPAAVMHACDVIADDHTALMDALLEEGGVDGFLYSVQNAELTRFTADEYRAWVRPAELKELDHLHKVSEYVVLHCCGWDADEAGTTDRMENWRDYPANLISWASYVDDMTIPQIREFFHGLPAWGGFDNRLGCLLQTGTRQEIQAETQRLMEIGGKKGYMLGPDCSLQNIGTERVRWVIEAAGGNNRKIHY
ncbi:MAG: hypothetical protein IJV14_12320 [Lachnospiraceae bacterium]|nr:hypothetical protein [Lachnospiraceae bacterium]